MHNNFIQYGIGVYQCCTCMAWIYSHGEVLEHVKAHDRSVEPATPQPDSDGGETD